MRFFLFSMVAFACIMGCRQKHTMFEEVSSSHSNIDFNNRITENDTLNPLKVVNIYNGGGVGVGDFNNDGLQDIYFTGNMVPGKLYLNKGDFRFEDLTEKAGVEGKGRWARGIAVVDINNDGLPDMYIANTLSRDSSQRRNILYVNQGIDPSGVPRFKDMAAEYGLDAHVQSTMAAFFDYDNDGDPDMYLTVNEAYNGYTSSVFLQRNVKNPAPSVGKLFRNDFDAVLNHPRFTDVSKQAGIVLAGYGHGATICDINRDGWKDIYVSNDFLSSNTLYINNGNGTFSDRSREYFKHTSFNTMGQDVIDINNDGLSDVVELDMNPKDNYRKKMMLSSNNYSTYQNFERYEYQYQYVRNTLQLNRGPRLFENDSVGPPVFSEIGFMSGIAETDWSWTPLIVDFDNDGFRDMVVTNGFPKDVTDHDFISYRENSSTTERDLNLLDKMPVIRLKNYGFKNRDGLRFDDVSGDWGLDAKSFSNGAVYADLDNDGDMDMVVNNVNDKAFVYRNTIEAMADSSAHYLQVKFIGDEKNRQGLGAWVDIYYDGKMQSYENSPYRGYLSTHQCIAHFGTGRVAKIDSLVVKWPNNRKQVLREPKINTVVTLKMSDADQNYLWKKEAADSSTLFREITKAAAMDYQHLDFDFIDFNIQTTLPHKLTEYCPALAAADLNGDGLDDLVVGGNFNNQAAVFLQQSNGHFGRKRFPGKSDTADIRFKDEGILLFDANGDGRQDIYIASGGYKSPPGSRDYQDRLYINDGKEGFTLAKDALPQNHTSKLCVRSMDFNNDGKPDLFVSGRNKPWQYPKPVSSMLLRNDSEGGKAKFTDVTADLAPGLSNIGMVCDALFTDFNNDNQTDLILTGEWMPVKFFLNKNGRFTDITPSSGVADQTGWWNSIVAGDFRHTGRMDYIVGNLGLNSLYKAGKQYPVSVIAKDFDNNGSYEAIPYLFLQASDGTLKEFPSHGRDDILDKLPGLKKRFNDYNKFAIATIDTIFTAEQRKGAQHLQAVNLQSSYLRNDGNGKFTMIPLPDMAQVSVLNGMIADDFDGDGNLDVLINGNDYGTEVSIGRYDALNGLLLKGDGRGNFKPLSIMESGIYIPGNGKALVKLRGADGNYRVAASQYRGKLKLFELRKKRPLVRVRPEETAAVITYEDGSVEKKEFFAGSSFLSQSSGFILLTPKMRSITIYNNQGSRLITIK